MATRIPKPTSTMRKTPSQARSRATIEAMLNAAAHILGERGWAGITTNAVADVAGVSIGSVYQYFPNKLALIEAVRQRHYDEVLTVLRAATDEATPRTRRIAAFVDGMIAVHSRSPTAHRVLMEEVPQNDETPPKGDAFKRNYQSGCEAFFKVNARYAQVDSSKLRAQVLAAAVAGIVHDAAHQGTLASPAMRQELLALVEACLSRRQSPTAARSPAAAAPS